MSKNRKLSRNQRSRKDRAEAKRVLRNGISGRSSPFDGQNALRFQVLKLFSRAQRLHDTIDAAYEYQPLVGSIPPTAPANVLRFKLMIDLHLEVTKLFGRAMELGFLAGGLKKEDNWVPLLVERCRQDAKLRAIELSKEVEMSLTRSP
jgi:hypothetical protein